MHGHSYRHVDEKEQIKIPNIFIDRSEKLLIKEYVLQPYLEGLRTKMTPELVLLQRNKVNLIVYTLVKFCAKSSDFYFKYNEPTQEEKKNNDKEKTESKYLILKF